MARRPDVFDVEQFQAVLRRNGCPESFVSPITSDFRLFVPIVLSRLGADRVFELVDGARSDLGLGAQDAAWRLAAQQIVAWASDAVDDYRALKTAR